MTDPIERLEAELAALRPTALSPRVIDAIADELAESGRAPLRFADRCLLTVMGAGSLAACVIVGLLAWHIIGGRGGVSQPSSSPSPQVVAVQSPPSSPSPASATLGQYQQMLARSSDAAVPELLR